MTDLGLSGTGCASTACQGFADTKNVGLQRAGPRWYFLGLTECYP